MTENEAIEKLRAYHKCQKMQVKGIYEDCNARLCDNCDLCYAQGNTGEHIKSIEIAIQTLEKRIPKKPIMKQYFEDLEEKYLCCPTCGEILTDRIPADNKTFCFHCMNCGQKLDWSDEE